MNLEISEDALRKQQLEDLNAEIISCKKCPRLVAYQEEIGRVRRKSYRDQEYWSKPVPGFGNVEARLMVVGLAPGAHGSNRTGRMFTGDDSGVFLYRALHRVGLANQPSSINRNDGLVVRDIFITAVCRCAPPDNKPTTLEKKTCLPYLIEEIKLIEHLEGIIALGRIGFEGVQDAYTQLGYPQNHLVFGHNHYFQLGKGLPWLVSSYHPSRQNTQTGRLTETMFDEVWAGVTDRLTTIANQ